MAVYSVENNRNNKKLRISRFVRQRGFKSSEVVALNLYILHEEVVDPGLPIFLITIPSWRFTQWFRSSKHQLGTLLALEGEKRLLQAKHLYSN